MIFLPSLPMTMLSHICFLQTEFCPLMGSIDFFIVGSSSYPRSLHPQNPKLHAVTLFMLNSSASFKLLYPEFQ